MRHDSEHGVRPLGTASDVLLVRDCAWEHDREATSTKATRNVFVCVTETIFAFVFERPRVARNGGRARWISQVIARGFYIHFIVVELGRELATEKCMPGSQSRLTSACIVRA